MIDDDLGIVSYDPLSGQFFRLKSTGGRMAGSLCGSPHINGYVCIGYNGRKVYAHRLAWKIMTGNWPSKEIDHINSDRSDNRFSNLREATRSQNLQNKKITSANKSGFKGVMWSKARKRWQAKIKINRKIKFLGYFDCPRQAHAAYLAAANELFGEFARAE